MSLGSPIHFSSSFAIELIADAAQPRSISSNNSETQHKTSRRPLQWIKA
jgi:hypothetical protein